MFRLSAAFVSLAFLTFHPLHAGPVRLPDGLALDKIDFDRHVHALLERQGCNAGACHGNRDGKGGFSLSLFAESPAKDHTAIVTSRFGRLVNVNDPDGSLLLLKATGQPKHEGGMRVQRDSWEYEVLRQWIAGGARREWSSPITALHVVPSEHFFQPDEKLQLKVIAHFADGSKEDVTCFSDYRIAEPTIPPDKKEPRPTRVDRTGEVWAAAAADDTGITVVYRGKTRVMRARVAAMAKKGAVYPKVPETNFIDREVFRDLRRLNIVPSDVCSDEHFLRRVHIDLFGTAPTLTEVRDFLASKDPAKRAKKIDELLADARHAAMLATRFCETMDFVGGHSDSANSPRTKAAQMTHDWFRKRLSDNMPYDRMVEKILTATSKEGRDDEAWQKEKRTLEAADNGFGTTYAKRDTLDHFWRLEGLGRSIDSVFGHTHPQSKAKPLEAMAERVAATFLGVQLECARCHVHPTDGWTPADHHAFANIFAQVQLETITADKKLPNPKQLEQLHRAAIAREVFVGAPANQLAHPETGASLKPRPLGGPEIDYEGDARQAFVRWLVHRDNPFFTRHFVNTMWQHYFGIGLIESTDNYTSAFPTENTKLLDLLARDFIASGFDIRKLERLILTSRTYELSATLNDSNKRDKTQFSRVVSQRFTGRVAANLIHDVLETREDFGPGVPAGLSPIEVMHLGRIGRQLSTADQYKDRIDRIVVQFARRDLMSRCSSEPGNSNYLFLYGSSEINAYIHKSPRIARLAKSDRPNEIFDECFLATLSRLPTAGERKTCIDYLQRDPKMRLSSLENIIYALINTNEFAKRH
jgi:hypothetical protein